MRLPEIITLTNSDGTQREMSGERFMQILSARLKNVVQGEGSITAKVVSSNEWTDDEGNTRIIVSFNAISKDMVNTLKEMLANGDYQGALNLSLTSNFRPDSRYVPSLGEVCKLSIGFVQDREDNTVLRVTGVAPLPNATKATVSLEDLLTGIESAPSVEPELTAEAIQTMDANALKALAEANEISLSEHLNAQGKIKQANLAAVRSLLVEELV